MSVLLHRRKAFREVSADYLDNLVGWWKFDENTGTNAGDDGSGGNDGTLINGASWIAPGKVGTSHIDFDGVDQEVNMGNVHNNDGTEAMSWAMWVKANSSASFRYIVGHQGGSGNQPGYSIWWSDSSEFGMQIRGNAGGGNRISMTSTPALSDGVWYHLVATYDGGEAASGLNFYVDGVLDTNPTVNEDTLTASATVTADFTVGSRSTYASTFFDGEMDDVRVYSVELTAAQVASIYDATS